MATYTGTLGAAPAFPGVSSHLGVLGGVSAFPGVSKYLGTLGAAPVYPGVSHYRGGLGAAPELRRVARGILDGENALWATVREGILEAAPKQDGQPVVIDPAAVLAVRYLCILTGGADGETDLYLPITSFHALYRVATENGNNQSLLTVTVPNASEWGPKIRARQNGTIKVQREEERAGGTDTATLLSVPFERSQDQRGGRRTSIQLRGIIPDPGGGGKRVKIPEILTWAVDETGEVRFRAPPNNELRPGDQVEVSGGSYQTSEVWYRVGTRVAWIEVKGEPI